MQKIEKILIRFPNWLGDIIMSLPLVEALRANYPEAKIYALIKKPFDQIFKTDSRFEAVFGFDPPQNLWQKCQVWRKKKLLSGLHFDLAILCTRSVSSALELFFMNINYTVGANRLLGQLLLSSSITIDKTEHQRLQYLKLLEPFGIYQTLQPSFLEIAAETSFLDDFGIAKNKPFVILHPGASYGSAKTWPLEFYESLAKKITQELALDVVFCGDKTQSPPRLSSPLVHDLTGKTDLLSLCRLIQASSLIVCNDSGPMHIADALNKPLLAIFGPTDPVKTGPVSPRACILQQKVSCGPCFKRTCPLSHDCMNLLEPDMIFQKVKHLIKKYGTS